MDKHGSHVKSGSLATSSAELVAEVQPGATRAGFYFAGTHAGFTLNFDVSFDEGTTYVDLECTTPSDIDTGAVGSVAPSNNAAGAYTAAIPPGATHLRLVASARTSGTVAGKIMQRAV